MKNTSLIATTKTNLLEMFGNNLGSSEEIFVSLAAVLDSLHAAVYVADMTTYEVLFFNKYGREIWGEPTGKKCFELFQAGQTQQCAFCTNSQLLDTDGNPKPPLVWESQNTVTGRWYQCHDQVIPWLDGRLVKMDIATDITDLKVVEHKLKEAKEQAEKLALTDELTGISNRRDFNQMGQWALRQAQRFDRPLSLIMVDVDHFKLVNDTYGHQKGDELLQKLAEVLCDSVREVDMVARMGGDEFVVMLPETDLAAAGLLAERIRIAVSAIESPLPITVSLGVAQLIGLEETLESLVERADSALYDAKQRGRDRTAFNGLD